MCTKCTHAHTSTAPQNTSNTNPNTSKHFKTHQNLTKHQKLEEHTSENFKPLAVQHYYTSTSCDSAQLPLGLPKQFVSARHGQCEKHKWANKQHVTTMHVFVCAQNAHAHACTDTHTHKKTNTHTAPHRTAPHHTTPQHTARHNTTPNHTTPHHTTRRRCQ